MMLAAGSAQADPFASELATRRARFVKEGARPQAAVPLCGLLDLWDQLADRAPLVAFLDEALASKAAPEVRARAGYLRSLTMERQGHREEAAALRRKLGLIDRFMVAGPFDNEGKAGHETAYGPETGAFDAKASFAGKDRRVGWRLMPEVATEGVVGVDTFLRPETNVTAYLTVAVRADKAVHAALRLGSSGAVKAWVNGRSALTHDVYRPVRFDQDAAPIDLMAGWNRVTIKLSAGDSGGARLLVRLSAPDGGPLPELAEISTEHLTEAPLLRGAFAGRVMDLGRELQTAAHARPRDAAAHEDLGRYLHFISPEDPTEHHAADELAVAVRLAPSAERLLWLARAQSDANEKRKTLEQGLARAVGAERAPLGTELGEEYDKAHREHRAEALWQEALAADAGYWPARLKLAELASERGLPARAAAMYAEMEKAGPPPLSLLRAEASLAMRRGRRAEAEKLLARLAEADHTNDDAATELVGLLRGRGAIDEAVRLLDGISRARPDLLSARLDRAELLEGVGRLDEAHATLERALAIAPEDARLLERDGRILHRLGQEILALERLGRALELRPQNPELRAYLTELQPKKQDSRADLARAYAEDAAQVIARAQKVPAPAGASARVLLDSEVTRVHSNGLSETFDQRMVEVLDERGAREQGAIEIRFTPDTQTVEVRAARLYKKNGDVVEASSTDEQDLSEPWYGLYYDLKAQAIRFSALEPGDVIDVEYVVSDVGRRNLLADYYGDLHFFQEELPRVESRYVLIAPRDKKLYFNQPRLPALERKDQISGDEAIYSFRATATPKIDSEPGMPGFSEVAAYVHVSTYQKWDDVATWYQGLIKGQLDASPQIRDAVREATRGITDERAKIRAIYELVVTKTRYVGLEFGIHGYQPYRTPQVFARKFGDCKDKASLLVVMLKEAGIAATMVLARTRHGGDLDAQPASLAPFDHAIAYIPKYDWFLDGTAEFSGSDELPAQDQDIHVLVVNEHKLVRTPVPPALHNTVVTDWRVALDPSGDAHVEERLRISGEAAHEWRNHYQSPGERNDKYSKAWNDKYPGARLDKLEMAVEDREKPVEVRAALDVPHWARPEGGGLVMPILGREADMLRNYARLSSRRHDLILGYPWRQEDRIVLTLPRGFAVKRAPETRTVESPMGRFTLTVEPKGATVVVTSTLQVDRHRISEKDYPEFRELCRKIDELVGQELTVAP
jgi:transglutaminase-like putative cysteine protease/Tfp pilus assembly protein PilF